MPSEREDVVVGVVDVGGPKNIGWAILSGQKEVTGHNLDDFVDEYAARASTGHLALGFEAPMFIPIGRPTARMTAQRLGENGRPWSAGAGAAVTTLGLAVVTHVLSKLRPHFQEWVIAQDWNNWPRANELLLFEAFVSGSNHAGPGDHHLDALSAARAFKASLDDLDAANAVTEHEVFSLAGACAVRAGWPSRAIAPLSEACLVIRPDGPLNTPKSPPKEISAGERKACPECGHLFSGTGWGGVDAHWKSKHEDIMPYEDAWPLIRSGMYSR